MNQFQMIQESMVSTADEEVVLAFLHFMKARADLELHLRVQVSICLAYWADVI